MMLWTNARQILPLVIFALAEILHYPNALAGGPVIGPFGGINPTGDINNCGACTHSAYMQLCGVEACALPATRGMTTGEFTYLNWAYDNNSWLYWDCNNLEEFRKVMAERPCSSFTPIDPEFLGSNGKYGAHWVGVVKRPDGSLYTICAQTNEIWEGIPEHLLRTGQNFHWPTTSMPLPPQGGCTAPAEVAVDLTANVRRPPKPGAVGKTLIAVDCAVNCYRGYDMLYEESKANGNSEATSRFARG